MATGSFVTQNYSCSQMGERKEFHSPTEEIGYLCTSRSEELESKSEQNSSGTTVLVAERSCKPRLRAQSRLELIGFLDSKIVGVHVISLCDM
ncbi:hypothetical protein TNCV_2327251 [Trichonephila clavipes]|nr:hypothetical protein TNCV_2327251 [Trichonephila clavipes]